MPRSFQNKLLLEYRTELTQLLSTGRHLCCRIKASSRADDSGLRTRDLDKPESPAKAQVTTTAHTPPPSDRLHDLGQDFGLGPEGLVGQEGQRGVGHVQVGQEVGALGVDVDQAGEELVLAAGSAPGAGAPSRGR